MLFRPFFLGAFSGPKTLFFSGVHTLSKQVVYVWTIRWLRELFLLCQLVVKLGARAAMDIYGVDADELAHCVALHVIEMKFDEIIVRKCSRVLRLIMERTGRRAAMFPFAVVLAGMERALISPLPSDDMAREPLVRDLCSPGLQPGDRLYLGGFYPKVRDGSSHSHLQPGERLSWEQEIFETRLSLGKEFPSQS